MFFLKTFINSKKVKIDLENTNLNFIEKNMKLRFAQDFLNQV